MGHPIRSPHSATFDALMLPAFDPDMLAVAPPTPIRFALLIDTQPFPFFNKFL